MKKPKSSGGAVGTALVLTIGIGVIVWNNTKHNTYLSQGDNGNLRTLSSASGASVAPVTANINNVPLLSDPVSSNSVSTSDANSNPPRSTERKLKSGWDEGGMVFYKDRMEMVKGTPTKVIDLAGQGEVTVSGVTNDNGNFWAKVDGKADWEEQTFAIFKKYVTPETIVVDFGTWIGPTLLFHGQFSQHSYGIEADPVAFAVAEYNVEQNREKAWGKHLTLESACVSAPDHVGSMTMRGAKAPGASMSGITDKLARPLTGSWTVQCYTLPSILEKWGVDLRQQHVMLKIDIESYECVLLPSFYDWLKDVDSSRLPTIYITFHPEIKDCSPPEWEAVLRIFKLYPYVAARSDTARMSITKDTTMVEFEAMKTELSWNQRGDSAFVLDQKVQ